VSEKSEDLGEDQRDGRAAVGKREVRWSARHNEECGSSEGNRSIFSFANRASPPGGSSAGVGTSCDPVARA